MLIEIHPYINIFGSGTAGWTSQPLQTIHQIIRKCDDPIFNRKKSQSVKNSTFERSEFEFLGLATFCFPNVS